MNRREQGRSRRKVYTQVGYDDIAVMKAVGGTAFGLYCYLSLRMGQHTSAWPTYQKIREDTGIKSSATIRKALDALIDHGVLIVEQQRKSGRQASNLYTILDPPSSSETETSEGDQSSETVISQSSETVIGQITETEQELDSGEEEDSREEDSSIAPAARSAKSDPLFEAVAEAWLGQPYPDLDLNDLQRGVLNAALKHLRASGATPDEVPDEWQKMRDRYDNPSPMALAKNWKTNGTGPRRQSGSKYRSSIDQLRERRSRERRGSRRAAG